MRTHRRTGDEGRTLCAVTVAIAIVAAMGAQAQTTLRVPAGRTITAELQGKSARIATQKEAKVVAFEFGRLEQGKFVAYRKDEPMVFETPFAVRVRYDAPPPFDRSRVTLAWGDGERVEVPIARTAADPTTFLSGAMFFDDPRTCTGLQVCGQAKGFSDAP